ncbi:MAG: long-chain fatty acid--CoA ligase [Dehalococcoidales bacterium]|nr:long-chain fatty acid--CoA ligase [Dehalococcoidales bacterium]
MSAEKPWYGSWTEGVPKTLDYPEIPLFSLLSRAAEKWPDSTAFSCGEERLSYRELDELSDRLAAGLDGLGIKSGDRVLIFLGNSLEFVISYYGILKAGGTVASVNPLSRQAELRHQLIDTAATAIISGSQFYPLVKEVKDGTELKVIILTDTKSSEEWTSLKQILESNPAKPPHISIRPRDDVAAIVYTGGTTGLAKGVLLTHYNLVANAMQNNAWFGWSHQDIIIGLLPFYHSWGGCTCLNSPVYSGARVVIIPRFDAEGLLRTIEKERATVMYGAASMFTTLTNSPAINRYDISSLRYVKSGAMPIPPEIRGRWEKQTGVRLALGYGLSEASPETHNSPLKKIKPGTIGIPACDTDARIVDEETGQVELVAGETGEMIIKGPQVMKGYLNQPDDTREALRDGWLYTGDLAMMDEEGYFHVLDRKKETIKYKGYTIAPAEVEAILYEHPAVRECAVIGKPDSLSGEIPKAYVVVREEHLLEAGELIDFCAWKISPYKRIREVEFIDEIPKTGVGKMLRRVLRDKERADQS